MANQINNDLRNIKIWAYQLKINFKPDTSKRAQEVKFRRKIQVVAHPQLVSNT